MTYLTGEVTVIHNEDQVDFSAFTYSKVQSSVSAAYTINGTSIWIEAGDTLEVVVHKKGTTLSPNYVLLGNPVPPQTRYKTGLISGDSSNEVWQFVNINSGNPTG